MAWAPCALVWLALGAAPGGLTVRSSSPFLDESFAWAKTRALSYVRTGTQPDFVPCYFAAMSDREFCVRDTAHMLAGAHLLGLDRENWSMVRAFAWGANRRLKQDPHWPRWHYPYTGPGGDDGGSCQWRTLPAPFDLAWRAWEQYLWTGDRQWVDDPELLAYHAALHSTFLERQNWCNDGVADELQQLASYFEFPAANEQFIRAGDSVGCQYQALRAYAGVLAARGQAAEAHTVAERADRLRASFETHWYDPAAQRYIRGFDRFGGFRADWGRENSYFMPLTLITDQGPRTAAYLDFIEASLVKDPLNIEATTYLPELFYQHGRAEAGWRQLAATFKTRHNYPEVSFTCIANTVAGLLGVAPDGPRGAVATLGQPPAELAWVEADGVRVGANELRVRHDGPGQTTLTNTAGPAVVWTARFRGAWPSLTVDGQPGAGRVAVLNGFTITSVETRVAPGATVVVATAGQRGPDLPPPPVPRLPARPTPPAPTPGAHGLTELTPTFARCSWGPPVEFDRPPLAIGGLACEHGLKVSGVSAVRYELRRQYARLSCDVGFADAATARGAAEFTVYGGGDVPALLYTSGPLRGKARAGARHVSLDVSECEFVILGVKPAEGGGFDDRVVWGNPRLTTKGTGRQAPPPAAPTGLRAARLSHSRVELVWSATAGAEGYDVYCGTLSVGSAQQPALTVDGLSPNTAYGFTVKAYDADGQVSAASEPLAVTTPLPPDRVQLSDLTWASATASFGSVQRDRSVDAHPLRLGGTTYDRGLGTHAVSTIVYDLAALGRGYERFLATVGVDDEVRGAGSVVFQVFVDGQRLFDSGPLTSAAGVRQVDVSVRGAKELRLVVSDGGDGIASDHADWADARLANAPGGQ